MGRLVLMERRVKQLEELIEMRERELMPLRELVDIYKKAIEKVKVEEGFKGG